MVILLDEIIMVSIIHFELIVICSLVVTEGASYCQVLRASVEDYFGRLALGQAQVDSTNEHRIISAL